MNSEMIVRNIQVILAPVVMITACAILLGVLHGRYQTINDRLRLMVSERLELWRRIDSNSSDAFVAERLRELDEQFPDLLHRHKLAHDAIFVVGCAILMFVGDMFLIASAVLLGSVWTATGTLVLFLAGAGAFFVGALLMTLEVRTSHRTLHYEVRRVMNLGKTLG